MSDQREKVEEAANRIRKELLVTLGELDRRRDQALDPRYQVHKHLRVLIAAAAAFALATGALVGLALHRRSHRAQRLRHERRRAIKRAWFHPERVATRAKERPAPQELGRKVAVAFGLAFGSQLARRAALKLLPDRQAQAV